MERGGRAASSSQHAWRSSSPLDASSSSTAPMPPQPLDDAMMIDEPQHLSNSSMQQPTSADISASSSVSHSHAHFARPPPPPSSQPRRAVPASPSNTSQSENEELEDGGEESQDEVVQIPSFRDSRRNTIKGNLRPSSEVMMQGGADAVAQGSTCDNAPANGGDLPRPRSLAPQSPTEYESWRQPSPSHLPHEILLHIFKYVATYPPDLRACLQVSRDWCVCGVELLWHRPTFYNVVALQKLTTVMTDPNAMFDYATFIRRLNFALLAEHLDDELFRPMRACVRLERLTLQGCTLISDEALQDVLAQTKNLVAIDLTDVHKLRDTAIDVLAASCPRLQGINLSNCVSITSRSVARFAKACKLLRRVKLCQCTGVGDEALTALTAYCPILLEVDLIGCTDISDASVREIWRKSFHMRELRLAQCGALTDLAFPAPTSSLGSITGVQRGPSLAELQWGGTESAPASRGSSPGANGAGDASGSSSANDSGMPRTHTLPLPPPLTHLAPPRLFDHLRILDLTNSSFISDAAIEGIISSVPRIRNLVLAKCNRLTDESLYSIAKLGKNLHYLHLGHVSNITDRAVTHLARACTRLRYIDLACCPLLTDVSVFELALNLPKLRRIGLVRVLNLTDQAIYSLVDRHTCLERIHLSYCENISIPAVFWLLQRLTRLTHLSLTGVPAFRRPELQKFCRQPPKDFNEHQRSAFCVYSGKGVNDLRRYLQHVYSSEDEKERAAEFGALRPEVAQAMAQISAAREHGRSSRAVRHATSAAAAMRASGLAPASAAGGETRDPFVWDARAQAAAGPSQMDTEDAASGSLQSANDVLQRHLSRREGEREGAEHAAAAHGSRNPNPWRYQSEYMAPMQLDAAGSSSRPSMPLTQEALQRAAASQYASEEEMHRVAAMSPDEAMAYLEASVAQGATFAARSGAPNAAGTLAADSPVTPSPASGAFGPAATAMDEASSSSPAMAQLAALATPPLEGAAPMDEAEGSRRRGFAEALRGTLSGNFTRYRG